MVGLPRPKLPITKIYIPVTKLYKFPLQRQKRYKTLEQQVWEGEDLSSKDTKDPTFTFIFYIGGTNTS